MSGGDDDNTQDEGDGQDGTPGEDKGGGEDKESGGTDDNDNDDEDIDVLGGDTSNKEASGDETNSLDAEGPHFADNCRQFVVLSSNWSTDLY